MSKRLFNKLADFRRPGKTITVEVQSESEISTPLRSMVSSGKIQLTQLVDGKTDALPMGELKVVARRRLQRRHKNSSSSLSSSSGGSSESDSIELCSGSDGSDYSSIEHGSDSDRSCSSDSGSECDSCDAEPNPSSSSSQIPSPSSSRTSRGSVSEDIWWSDLVEARQQRSQPPHDLQGGGSSSCAVKINSITFTAGNVLGSVNIGAAANNCDHAAASPTNARATAACAAAAASTNAAAVSPNAAATSNAGATSSAGSPSHVVQGVQVSGQKAAVPAKGAVMRVRQPGQAMQLPPPPSKKPAKGKETAKGKQPVKGSKRPASSNQSAAKRQAATQPACGKTPASTAQPNETAERMHPDGRPWDSSDDDNERMAEVARVIDGYEVVPLEWTARAAVHKRTPASKQVLPAAQPSSPQVVSSHHPTAKPVRKVSKAWRVVVKESEDAVTLVPLYPGLKVKSKYSATPKVPPLGCKGMANAWYAATIKSTNPNAVPPSVGVLYDDGATEEGVVYTSIKAYFAEPNPMAPAAAPAATSPVPPSPVPPAPTASAPAASAPEASAPAASAPLELCLKPSSPRPAVTPSSTALIVLP